MYRYLSHIILILFIILIMGSSLWSPGGILLLDYLSAPGAIIDWGQNAWYFFPQIFVDILGFEWGTKLFFFLILWLAGYLGILFARKMVIGGNASLITEVTGAIFFIINPFSYERMMVQPVIFLGIILLGYCLYFLLFSESSTFRRWALLGLSAGLAINLFLHGSFMVLLILILFGILFLRTKKDILGLCLATGIIVIMNLNWILAPLFGITNSVNSISTFSSSNLEAFETQALAPLDVWGTNLLLYGFWGERYANHYANVDFLSSLWYVAGILIVCLSLYGLYSMWTAGQRKLVAMLGVIAVCALVFGIGIASPLTEGLTRWMIEYIPLWQGYREPQKWIGLLMIVEGIGLIAGVAVLLRRFATDIVVRISILISVLLLFLIWSPGPLMGYHGQLSTTVYPSEFEEVRNQLRTTNDEGRILALPWHSYIGCSWMGRPTVANPIRGLMGPLAITVADNIEVGPTLYSNSTSTESRDVEEFLRTRDYSHIAAYNYSHILLMRECANSDTYVWLDAVESCTLDTENRYISLYRCER